MSIDIDWDALTSGPEGAALAESIRSFVHEKFQQVALPRFIRSVEVHSFEFGDVCPKIVLKDLSDPLPDFYEDDEDDDEEVDAEDAEHQHDSAPAGASSHPVLLPGPVPPADSVINRRDVDRNLNIDVRGGRAQLGPLRLPMPGLPSNLTLADHIASPLLLSRSGTPGIPGGTSNLNYFHLPLANRVSGSGSQTPMAAVRGWQEQQAQYRPQLPPPRGAGQHSAEGEAYGQGYPLPSAASAQHPDPSTRPSTAHSQGTHHADGPLGLASPRSPSQTQEPDPNDLQVVLHISYKGNVRLSLTAEILLDYPMTSFVGIPFKLNIVGLDFDGVALVALLNVMKAQATEGEEPDRRAHFCFLSPEDAETLVGAESILDEDSDGIKTGESFAQRQSKPEAAEQDSKLGGLLRGLRVESEIGKTKDGKQNLKNVGKVENFILEQVRRIFEDEFVFPSFWTFLV